MDPPTIRLEFEIDHLKNEQLGNTASKPVDASDGVTNLEAGDTDGPGSYLAIQLTTIQIIDSTHVLLVWHTVYHPNIGRRFQSAVLTIKLAQTGGSTTGSQASAAPPPIRVQQFAPRKAFGGTSNETKTIHWGLQLPLKIPAGPIEFDVIPSIKKESTSEIEHAFVVAGSARGVPHKNTCVWTLEENEASQRGLPSEVCFAALVECSGPISCEVTATGWVTGGFKPPYHLKTKTPKSFRSLKIDPETYRGKLKEFSSIQDVSQCLKLLENWSGTVEGAVLEFKEKIVRA